MSISAITIGASGMRAASARLSASASNIANARTTGTAPGQGAGTVYLPLRVDTSDASTGAQAGGVSYTVNQNRKGFGMAYDPQAAGADANGMIATPDVDMASELVEVIGAREQFKASAMTVRVAAEMKRSVIDILA